MNILDRVKALEFPAGEYVVVGGVLEVYGIRDAGDIDIVASPELFERLEQNGWKRKRFFHGMRDRKMLVSGDGEVEVLSNYRIGGYKPDTRRLIEHAHVVDGVPLVPLAELRQFKQELGRPKDKRDIELIDRYTAETFDNQ